MTSKNMDSEKQYFILRQISALTNKGQSVETALDTVLSTVLNQADAQKAVSTWQNSNSLVAALIASQVLNVNEPALARLVTLEKHGHRVPIEAILERQKMLENLTLSVKGNLSARINYSILLMTIATFITFTLSLKVLPKFQDLFQSFQIELPALTAFVISSADNFVLPLFMSSFILLLGIFMYRIKRLSPKSTALNFFKFIPFLNRIYHKSNQALSLQEAKTKSQAGEKITEQDELLQSSITPLQTERIRQSVLLFTETSELEFLFSQSIQEIESSIKVACTKFEAALTSIVTIIIGLLIVASYLPIFQFGNVI